MDNLTLGDVSIDEAKIEKEWQKIPKKVPAMAKVGLRQEASTLSGGESQFVTLNKSNVAKAKHCVFGRVL